jgi:aspartyl-tRNA(Asn)/glutamyl-tRNA(Gln) amidotransferase subunit B
MLDAARAALPELPAERIERFVGQHGLSEDQAHTLVWRPERADFFEAAVAAGADPRQGANWLERAPETGELTPEALAALVKLVGDKKISGDAGRTVLEALVAEGGEPAAIVEREGLAAMDAEGDGELGAIVDRVLADNAGVVEKIKGGNQGAIGALMGPIMRETKGRADGGAVQKLIREKLGI